MTFLSQRSPEPLALLNELLRRLLFLPEQASSYASSLDALHYVEIVSMWLIALAATVVALVFVRRYRRRPGDGRTPHVVAPLGLEIVTYGAILAFFLALWVVGMRQYVVLTQAPEDALEVYVTGKQWMWKFGYPEGVGSVDVLYVPAGRPVRLLLTSRDVIHSFYVPDFRVKRDVVPGVYTGLWFEAPRPGVHLVLCAELCGTGHSTMRGRIVVLPARAFDAWLEGRLGAPRAEETGATSLAALGHEAATRAGCFQCHSIDGTPLLGPTWRNAYGSVVRLADGDRVRVDEAYLTESMMDPLAKVVEGFSPVMPSYQGQLEPEEVAAIVELIKSLRDEPGAREEPRSHER